MRVLCALCLAVCAACASAPNLEQAVAVHNTMRQVILDSDQAFAAVYSTVEPAIAAETHGDDVAYNKAIAPYQALLSALALAKKAENTLHLALSQWQAGKLDDGLVRAAYACAADAAQTLSNAAGVMPSGGALYATSVALQVELRSLAAGAACVVPGAGK